MSPNVEMRLTFQKRVKRIVFSILISRLFLSSNKARITRLSTEFVFKISSEYPDAKLFHTREKLWKSFGQYLNESRWIGFEFGVASGAATKTFLKMPYIKTCLQWNGFDTFFGLPTEWGDLPKGAFSTNGKPPRIANSLVCWHIGYIEQTKDKIRDLSHLDKNFIVIFDFDLYSATKAAWDVIEVYLKPGDIIYFDEAYESDEAQIINEINASKRISLNVLGYTTMGIAFQVQA
jgi:hypothetical protein